MCDKKIARFELVETFITTASTRQAFTDIPQLRTQEDQQILIMDIELFPISVYGHSQQVNATPGIPNAEIPKVALVLYIQGEERVHLIPVGKLIHIQDGVAPFQMFPTSFDSLAMVDWTKSYFQFNAAPAPTYVIPLGVTYLKVNRRTNSPA